MEMSGEIKIISNSEFFFFPNGYNSVEEFVFESFLEISCVRY